MDEQDREDLAAVQELVKKNPVLSAFFLHKLGNLLGPVQSYAELIDRPTTTEAQRQKYVVNIQQCVTRVYNFLRECNIDYEYKKPFDSAGESV